MDHVQVMPQAAPGEQSSAQRELALILPAVPPAGTGAAELVTALMSRCPGSLVWFGARPRRWWAFAQVDGAWTLLETQTVQEIAQAITRCQCGTL